MTDKKKKHINDLITECFKPGDKHVDIFTKQEMTLAEAQVLVDYALKKQATEIGEKMANFMSYLSKYMGSELIDERDSEDAIWEALSKLDSNEVEQAKAELDDEPEQSVEVWREEDDTGRSPLYSKIRNAKYVTWSEDALTNITYRNVYTITYKDGSTDVFHVFKCRYMEHSGIPLAVQVVKDSKVLEREAKLTYVELKDVEDAVAYWMWKAYNEKH